MFILLFFNINTSTPSKMFYFLLLMLIPLVLQGPVETPSPPRSPLTSLWFTRAGSKHTGEDANLSLSPMVSQSLAHSDAGQAQESQGWVTVLISWCGLYP